MKPVRKFEKKEIVERYFQFMAMFEKDHEATAEKLMDFWQIDGVYDIEGFNAHKEVYEGQLAIHSYYVKRFTHDHQPGGVKDSIDKNYLPIHTSIVQIHEEGDQVTVFWSAIMKTGNEKKWVGEGCHVFSFTNDRIKHLRVNISSNPASFPDVQSGIVNSSVSNLRRFIF